MLYRTVSPAAARMTTDQDQRVLMADMGPMEALWTTLKRNKETRPMMRAQMPGHSCVLVKKASLPFLPNHLPPSCDCLHSAK